MPSEIKNLILRPELNNLLGIYSSLNSKSLPNTLNEFSGKNFSYFKNQLSDLVIEKIYPISQEIKKILKDVSYIDKILLNGAERASKISLKKVADMKKIIGF